MATSFVPADSTPGTSRTLIYTCPAATQAVAFAGTIANNDTTAFLDHLITIEIQKVDTSFVPVLVKAPITFGGSLIIPKIALIAGEKIYLTADAASVLVARLSLVEKT